MVHFFNPSCKIRSKQRTLCLWLQKENQLKDQPRINHLIDCEILQLFIRSLFFFCLYPHNIWSAWCGYQQLATYLEKQPVLLQQAHVDFIWVGTLKECTLLHVMCPSSLLVLFLLDIIKTYIRCEPGFFSLSFFFIFFDIKSLAISLWKNHKLIQIHTRKSKKFGTIFLREEKEHWCWPSALSMYSTVFHRKVKQPSVLISKIH